MRPAPASAAIDNSTLACDPTEPTYFPRGDHWAVTPTPDGPLPILYRQAAAGSDDMPDGAFSEFDSVQRAFLTWNRAQCGSGTQPNIVFTDGLSAYGADYPTQDRGDIEQDGQLILNHVVYFVEDDASWDADAQTVALTTNLRLPDVESIVTADMEFNGIDFEWRARPTTDWTTTPPSVGAFDGCSTGAANCFDVETVGLHEAGHFMGLNHVSCTDSVMFPQGVSDQERTVLSAHEIAGVCALYPPRPASVATDGWWGEACTAGSQCPDGVCIEDVGFEGLGYGYCTKNCTLTAECPDAYLCGSLSDGGASFCKPGPNGSGSVGPGDGVVDPETGDALDLCRPCDSGSQCSSGTCVNDGDSSICTVGCSSLGGIDCPEGFDCLSTDGGNEICWPLDPVGCVAASTSPRLNQQCYDEDPTNPAESYFAPCAPDLICFGFKPRCEGMQGHCVNYCNRVDTPCADGLTCCFGVEADGSCIERPPLDNPHGGCFNIRDVGQSCFVAENSVCEAGSECFFFGSNPTVSRCYQTCNSFACETGTTCIESTDGCLNEFAVCCEDGPLSDGQCDPGVPPERLDIGVECAFNEDCDSGMCLKLDGEAACSRSCNPVTGEGCPGPDVDVNGDGQADGGFTCRLVFTGSANEGRCWPRRGPISSPFATDEDDPTGGGCCSAVRLKRGDLMLSLLAWLPVGVTWLRRRRRREGVGRRK